MLWNEIFTRAAMFFTVVSASVVGLALMAQATDYGDEFKVFALVLLPVVLFVGFVTFGRVLDANVYDLVLVGSMNRLRRGYLDNAPNLEPYFSTSAHDDVAGVMLSAGVTTTSSVGMLWSTPFLISVVNGMIAGVLAGIFAEVLGAGQTTYLLAGFVAGVLFIFGCFVLGGRRYDSLINSHEPRFPTP